LKDEACMRYLFSGILCVIISCLGWRANADPIPSVPSLCNSLTGNILINCGFETGNPLQWIASGHLSIDDLTGNLVISGFYSLALRSGQPTASLSQKNVSTQPGQVYDGRFSMLNGTADVQVFWNDLPTTVMFNTIAGIITGSFQVIGTGND